MSTKITLLYGNNYHLYRDGFDYLPTLEVNRKVVELPDEFLKTLLKLVRLHESIKYILELTTELDKIDGGLFGINLKTGDKSEFKEGKFKKEKKKKTKKEIQREHWEELKSEIDLPKNIINEYEEFLNKL